MTSQSRFLIASLVVGVLGCWTPELGERTFDWTVGTWEGVRRDAADGTEAKMTMRVEPLIGGGGQLHTLEIVGGDGLSYRGTAVQCVDPNSGRWVWQYTSSPLRPFARYLGPEARADEIPAHRSEWYSISPQRTRDSRLLSELLPDGRWRRTMSISTDGVETWRNLWIDELRRTEP